MRIDTCVAPCMDMRRGVCTGRRNDMCADMCIGMYIGMRIGMRIEMCTDMRTDMQEHARTNMEQASRRTCMRGRRASKPHVRHATPRHAPSTRMQTHIHGGACVHAPTHTRARASTSASSRAPCGWTAGSSPRRPAMTTHDCARARAVMRTRKERAQGCGAGAGALKAAGAGGLGPTLDCLWCGRRAMGPTMRCGPHLASEVGELCRGGRGEGGRVCMKAE